MRILRSVRLWLLAMVMLAVPAASFAGIFISVNIAPPPLPVYEQPICPDEGYIWTPGYWAYGDEGYFWVPGTWVLAPQVGYLWTPGYWGWGENAYLWHAGYWGPHIGFYGGVNYGYGYFGHGYEGGRWDHDRFYYNRNVNNINITNIHNVYNSPVNNREQRDRVSYVGGRGGLRAQPTRQEQAVIHEQHMQPTPLQTQHQLAASSNRQQFLSVNHGRPAITATPRPAVFNNAAPGNRPTNGFNGARGGNVTTRGGNETNGSRPLITARPNDGSRNAERPANPGQVRGVPSNGGNQSQRAPAYGGNQGQRPLITARPNSGQNAERGYNAPANRPGFNAPANRPGYNAPNNPAQRTYNAPRENAAPRNMPEPRGSVAPQPRYNPAPERQAAPQPRYNAAPERQAAPQPRYNAPPQPRYNPPAQREPAPQLHYNAPPQPRQSEPRQQSAPREQSAPRGGGEPHGGGGQQHEQPHGRR